MLGKAILALIFAASVSYGGWAELWGSLAPRGGGATAWTPPGYSQSLFWWKFSETSGTNLVDSSVVGTNGAFVLQKTAASTNWAFSEGAFKPGVVNGAGNFAYVQSLRTTIGSGIISNQYTFAVWLKVIQSVLFSSPLLSRSTRYNIIDDRGTLHSVYCSVTYVNQSGTFPAMVTNTWMRYAIVRNGTNAYFYKNGALQTSSSSLATNYFTADAFWLAGNDTIDGSGARVFSGWLDDCYLTAYPFTATDATNDYLQGRSP